MLTQKQHKLSRLAYSPQNQILLKLVLLALSPSIMSLKVTSSGPYIYKRIAYQGILLKNYVRLNSLSFLYSRRRIIQIGPKIVTIGNSCRVGIHVFIRLRVKGRSRLCLYSLARRQPHGIASLYIIIQARQTSQSWLATIETIAAVQTIRARCISD